MKYVVLFVLLFLSLTSMSQDEDFLLVGHTAPVFSIAAGNEKAINPGDLNGKIVLINFFATWCAPCLMELPHLQKKVYKKYQDKKNFSVLVIGRDHTDAEIQAFKSKYNFDLPMYPDKSKAIFSLFATKFIPRNYIIKDGKIVYSSIGYSEEEFAKMVKLLGELLD